MAAPVIIEAAVNGGTTKAQNPHVPRSAEEIAEDALACIAAGASVVHAHVEFGLDDDTSAARYLEAFRPVLDSRPDALLYPTVNPGPDGTPGYDHLVPLAEAGAIRVGITDPGSLNLGGTHEGVPVGSYVYRNSFDLIERSFEICRRHRLGPSMAIYEPGFLRAALAWWRAGRLPQGAMVKLYLSEAHGLTGSPFGLPPTVTALDAYLELLDGCPLPWAVSVVGGDVCASDVSLAALRRGGHLHLGLEFYGGDRTPTNVELVEEAVALCARAGRPVATPEDAVRILGLPARRPQ